MKQALSVAALLVAHVVFVLAQMPDLSGTWQLSSERSRIVAAAGLAGLVGAGAPEALHITQSANETVAIESRINESHARLYKPGARIVTPVTVGPAGTITMTSRWEGRMLVSEGTRESSSGPSRLVQQVKEAISLSPDGQTLTIEITTRGPEETSTSTLVYTRALDVGSCKTWPTPCKT
jgi:hypothetical protein